MSRKARRPRPLLLVLFPWLLAPVGGWAAWQVLHVPTPAAAELTSLLGEEPLRTRATAAQEKLWLAEAFPEKDLYLPAPPVLSYCLYSLENVDLEHATEVRVAVGNGDASGLQEIHREDGNWLTGLALGNLLVRKGRISDAAQLFDRLMSRSRGRRTKMEEAQAAARGGRPWEGPGTGELTTLIYLVQASGYVKILNQQKGDDDLWWTLKSPIAGGKLIYAREQGLLVDKVIDGYELELPLDCSGAQLSSYDLYNNLIVGYLRVADFQGTPERRREEFNRSYTDPPAQNPLQALLRQEVPTIEKEPVRESWVWALSNSERLLRDRLRERRGYPQNARLAINLAGLIESAVERTPPEILDALLQQQFELLAVANEQRDRLTDEAERKIFDRALVRLNLLAAARQPRPLQTPPEVFAALDSAQKKSAGLVQAAQAQRGDPVRWVQLAAGEVEESELNRLGLQLGPHRAPWLSALRQDLAAALARRADGLEVAEQRRMEQLAGALLEWRDPTPSELSLLRERLGWAAQLEGFLRSPWGALLVATLAAGVAWYLLHWLAVQLQLRRELFSSFYRIEVEQRLRRLR